MFHVEHSEDAGISLPDRMGRDTLKAREGGSDAHLCAWLGGFPAECSRRVQVSN
jgi:hypothetical protein